MSNRFGFDSADPKRRTAIVLLLTPTIYRAYFTPSLAAQTWACWAGNGLFTFVNSPTEKRDTTDPGDEIALRFRYQFAYGVVLLVNSVNGGLDYRAIWCEQYEDFLGELKEGLFDGIQVKTRQPELGAWQLNDEEFCKSVGRFVALDHSYPNRIRWFKFVSNAQFSQSSAERSEHLSAPKLLAAVKSVSRWEDLAEKPKKGFDIVEQKSDLEPKELFDVLKRLELICGPELRSFEAEIAHNHIPTIPACSMLSARLLGRIRDALIAKVFAASSLFSGNPSRHYMALNQSQGEDPWLMAKRLSTEDVTLVIREIAQGRFQYLPSLTSLHLSSGPENFKVLQKKMVRGGLTHHFEMMRRKAISAEANLLELTTRQETDSHILSQLENVVLSECDAALLRASQRPEPFGAEMLIDLQDRLNRIAETEPALVYNQHRDLLLGIAGLLTSECKVWWSAQFPIENVE